MVVNPLKTSITALIMSYLSMTSDRTHMFFVLVPLSLYPPKLNQVWPRGSKSLPVIFCISSDVTVSSALNILELIATGE